MTPLLVLFVLGTMNVFLIGKVESSKLTREAGAFVVGGKESKQNAWPFLVNIMAEAKPGYWGLCGGAIVSDRWVVTAAHCVPDVKRRMRVTAGDHNMRVREGTEQVREVKTIRAHPAYNKKTHENDVAVYEMTEPFDLKTSAAVSAVTLNDHYNYADCPAVGAECIIMGWGRTQNGGHTSDTLLEAVVPVVSNKECKAKYGNSPFITESQICAANYGTTDTCQGDSGGPMVCMCGGQQVHVGVVSYGMDCADHHYPGVYARTSAYWDWIMCTTGEGPCPNK